MTDNDMDVGKPAKTWLERLSIALLREPQDREQLVALLRDAQQRNLLDADSLAMIEGVLQVSSLRVRDTMVPRSQMVVIEQSATLDAILPIVIESAHSRFPVIGENRDDVVGFLMAKDLLAYHYNIKPEPFQLMQITRPPVLVPESKRLDVMLREFRLNHNHMAVVIDEYGGVSGLITIEDVLEQIVGEIEDEYDIGEEPSIKQLDVHTYIVKALTPIEEFNQYFHETLDVEEFDTIGGHIMKLFGYLPKRGETVHFGKYQVEVLNADKRRIRLLKFTVP
jgi:magnesium and cobalt transporter